jgi:hypothetical protein
MWARTGRDAHCSSPPARASSAASVSARRPCAGNEASGDTQLGGLTHEKRVGGLGAVDVNKARSVQRELLAELGECERRL